LYFILKGVPIFSKRGGRYAWEKNTGNSHTRPPIGPHPVLEQTGRSPEKKNKGRVPRAPECHTTPNGWAGGGTGRGRPTQPAKKKRGCLSFRARVLRDPPGGLLPTADGVVAPLSLKAGHKAGAGDPKSKLRGRSQKEQQKDMAGAK